MLIEFIKHTAPLELIVGCKYKVRPDAIELSCDDIIYIQCIDKTQPRSRVVTYTYTRPTRDVYHRSIETVEKNIFLEPL